MVTCTRCFVATRRSATGGLKCRLDTDRQWRRGEAPTMCAACGIADHIPTLPASSAAVAVATAPSTASSSRGSASGMKFAALRHKDCRFYLLGTMLSMMADNIEHVITYW